jgi:hypothetical protein
MDAHEGVLERVLRVGGVAKDAVDSVVEEGKMGPYERAKGIRITGRGLLDQFGFFQRGFRHAAASVCGRPWRGKPYLFADEVFLAGAGWTAA